MATGSGTKIFKPGQALFREGEASRSLFILRRGTVGIRKMKGAAQVEIARVYTNEVLGEISFFDRLPRSASAVAVTEVEAIEISFDALDVIYAKIPDYMRTIIVSITDRLRKANETIRRLQKNVVPKDGADEAPKEGAEGAGAEGAESEPAASTPAAAEGGDAIASAAAAGAEAVSNAKLQEKASDSKEAPKGEPQK